MKLPENPTRKVRDILAAVLQCPDYEINEKGLYEIKKLCDCLDTVISTMRLHAGDCCSLNTEVELFRGHWEDAKERCEELDMENKRMHQALTNASSEFTRAYRKLKELEIENGRLKDALKLTIDRWRLIGRKIWDTKVQASILELARQLEKDVEQILKNKNKRLHKIISDTLGEEE